MAAELLKISSRFREEFRKNSWNRRLWLLSVKTWGQMFRDTIFGLVVGTTTSDGGGPTMQLRLGYTSCRAQPTSVSYVAPPPSLRGAYAAATAAERPRGL